MEKSSFKPSWKYFSIVLFLACQKGLKIQQVVKPEFCPHAGDGEAYVVLNAIDDVASGVPWPSRQREATIDQFSYIL